MNVQGRLQIRDSIAWFFWAMLHIVLVFVGVLFVCKWVYEICRLIYSASFVVRP